MCDHELRGRPGISAAARGQTTSTQTGWPTGQGASGASYGKTAALIRYARLGRNALSCSSRSLLLASALLMTGDIFGDAARKDLSVGLTKGSCLSGASSASPHSVVMQLVSPPRLANPE